MNNFYLNRFLWMYSKPRLVAKWLKRQKNKNSAIEFMKNFAKPGDLVFDVGANYGWKTELFLDLGAKIVAIEPQSECVKILKKKFGSNGAVIIEPVALGSYESVTYIRKSDVRNQLSSMSSEWIAAVKRSGRFARFEWSSKEKVTLTTLDNLIAKYGVPAFCKIDTEGYEVEILKGLSQPIAAISLEYHLEFLGATRKCIDNLINLGGYEFNYTVGETPKLQSVRWMDSQELMVLLSTGLSDKAQGDVYARIRT